MAFIADGIDFLNELINGKVSIVSGMGVDQKGQKSATGVVYLLFGFLWFVVFGKFSTLDFSALVTCASFCQCFGLAILAVKVYATKCVKGLSSKMLTMFVLHLCTRLSSTSIKNGYVPVDVSGDYMYQLLDFSTLLLCFHLLYRIHKTHEHSYQEEFDTLPLLPLIAPCVVLAFFIHGSFNNSFFFDTLWQVSTNLETFVLLPQLWMLAKMGGKVDTVTAHFVACMVASGVMTFTFWSWTGIELEKRGPCKAHQLILGMQALRLVLGADFMYYYAMAWCGGTSVVLPAHDETEM
jgi:hypothetical protein